MTSQASQSDRIESHQVLSDAEQTHDPMLAMSSDELARARTGLSIHRTLMSADRTLMAWIRTSLSTGGFGFTLYKVLQGFQESGLLSAGNTPRQIGLLLIGLGTVAMLIGVVDYLFVLREIRLLKDIRLRRPVMNMAILMAALGTVLFVTVFAKVL